MNRRSFLSLTAAAPAALMAGALAAREAKAVEAAAVDTQARAYTIGKGNLYIIEPDRPDEWQELGQVNGFSVMTRA